MLKYKYAEYWKMNNLCYFMIFLKSRRKCLNQQTEATTKVANFHTILSNTFLWIIYEWFRCSLIWILLQFISKGPINIRPDSKQIMIGTEQATNHYQNQWRLNWLTHVFITWAHWVTFSVINICRVWGSYQIRKILGFSPIFMPEYLW